MASVPTTGYGKDLFMKKADEVLDAIRSMTDKIDRSLTGNLELKIPEFKAATIPSDGSGAGTGSDGSDTSGSGKSPSEVPSGSDPMLDGINKTTEAIQKKLSEIDKLSESRKVSETAPSEVPSDGKGGVGTGKDGKDGKDSGPELKKPGETPKTDKTTKDEKPKTDPSKPLEDRIKDLKGIDIKQYDSLRITIAALQGVASVVESAKTDGQYIEAIGESLLNLYGAELKPTSGLLEHLGGFKLGSAVGKEKAAEIGESFYKALKETKGAKWIADAQKARALLEDPGVHAMILTEIAKEFKIDQKDIDEGRGKKKSGMNGLDAYLGFKLGDSESTINSPLGPRKVKLKESGADIKAIYDKVKDNKFARNIYQLMEVGA